MDTSLGESVKKTNARFANTIIFVHVVLLCFFSYTRVRITNVVMGVKYYGRYWARGMRRFYVAQLLQHWR